MKKLYLIFCLNFIIINNSICSSSYIDSLKIELETSNDTKHKLNILNELAHLYRSRDIKISNEVAQEILEIAKINSIDRYIYIS